MRAHGIANYPDPVKVDGSEGFPGTIRGSGGSLTVEGISFSGPTFLAAEQACQQGGGIGHGPTLSERPGLPSDPQRREGVRPRGDAAARCLTCAAMTRAS
jgi:hypothetical protein